MSLPAKRVPDCEYLYERGRRYIVRVQVPRELKRALGKGELKKSLGGDLALAKRKYHNVVATIMAQIETARRGALQLGAPQAKPDNQPTVEEVEVTCYAHFVRMTVNMRGKVAHPVGDNPRELRNRTEGYRVMIESQVAAHAYDGWGTMAIDAKWLGEEHGWTLTPDSPLFEHLCRTMLRARLQCYRDELRRLEGKMGPDPDTDPLFGSQPPKRRKPAVDLGELMDKFTASRVASWSASTQRNYIIINRVIEEVCGKDTSLDLIDDEFCDNVRSILCRLPANYQKHPALTGRPIPEVIEIAAARGLPLIGPATINGHLNKFAAIIRFGREKGWITGNPMAGIDVPDPIDPSDNRPQLSEALRLSRIHGATLIIAKLDRLARNVAFVSHLMESKVDFLAVDFPFANRLTIHILAAVAEHEAQMIRERTKAALAAARARGVQLGGNRGNLPAVAAKGALASAVVRHGNAMRAACDLKPILDELSERGLSIRSIGRELDAMGIRPSRGGTWGASQVYRVIQMAAAR